MYLYIGLFARNLHILFKQFYICFRFIQIQYHLPETYSMIRHSMMTCLAKEMWGTNQIPVILLRVLHIESYQLASKRA